MMMSSFACFEQFLSLIEHQHHPDIKSNSVIINIKLKYISLYIIFDAIKNCGVDIINYYSSYNSLIIIIIY